MESELIGRVVYVTVILGWCAYPIIFFFRQKSRQAEERKRDRRSVIGVMMQGGAYSLVWSVRRPMLTPIVPVSLPIEIGLAVATMAILFGSLWIMWAAIRYLGRQWSFSARVLKEHLLVTEGLYRIVRHPIYTGMLGMLIATGLAASNWIAFTVALIVFLLGTTIRIRSEEKLLREAFGRDFDEYAKRVPAIVPFARGL